jgi:hypothetical protein
MISNVRKRGASSQRNGKRNLAATHDDVTAPLPNTLEAVFT